MTATKVVKEAIWLRSLLGDFGKIQKNVEIFVITKVRYSL